MLWCFPGIVIFVIAWVYLAHMTNYLEILYSSNIHALVFGNDDLNPVPSVLNGATKSCDHVPQTSHLGYRGHLTSNVHNMVSRPEMKNSFKQYKNQNFTILFFQSRILVYSTTDIHHCLLVMCTCSRFFSRVSEIKSTTRKRVPWFHVLSEFLPLRCHWCFQRVKQVSNKILHLFLRDGTVRCWGKESSCGP